MKKALKYTSILLGLLFMVLMGCKDDIDPIIETLDFERVFSPTDLDVNIRNQIDAEITWTLSEDADKYFAEISKDSLLFTSIMMTDTVLSSELPYVVTLEGDEVYSVRLTGYSDKGLSPSKTSTFAFRTNSEQILYALPDSMIGKEQVTISWPADSIVSYYTLNTGGKINLTAAEISAGQVTIVGLTFATEYDFVLFNEGNPKQRGNVTVTTLPEGETLTPDMDLEAKFASANEGDKFLLTGGDFINNYGTISIDKSITIKGISSSDMPILHSQFVIGDGVSVTFSKLKLDGDTILDDLVTTDLDHGFQFNSEATSIGDIIIEVFEVTNSTKSFSTGTSGAFSC
ncbi:MAG: hypothetical protein PF444_09990 [Bacteroidales bacterium]|jgi:hypothetical protein|nr:hypothetical protein [Bacteroidales bacterium]